MGNSQNDRGETVQGMAVPNNRAEAQAAKDHSDEIGKPGHALNVARADAEARQLEAKYGLGKKK